MKTFISDIIPKIQKYSHTLDNLTLLSNQHWVVINDIDKGKTVYIFRDNNVLLISQNGKVEKAKWEYLGNNSLLIDHNEDSYLYKHGFFDENILALKIDGKNEYVFLVNETKYDRELNSVNSVINFLNNKYIESNILHDIKRSTGIGINDKKHTLQTLYTTPNHTKIKVSESISIFGFITERYIINYADGERGEIFVKHNRRAYFKEKSKNRWATFELRYENIESCVKALHHYLKTNSILREGFIGKYS